jgi:hypothetical protein
MTATSNKPSIPVAATATPPPVSQCGADDANHRTIDLLIIRSKAPIGIAQAWPRVPTLQHQQLLAQTKFLCNQQGPRPENRRNGTQQKPKHPSLRLVVVAGALSRELVNAKGVLILFLRPTTFHALDPLAQSLGA